MPENHVKTKLCKYRLIKCGKYTELYEYEKPFGYNFTVKDRDSVVRKALKKRADNISRARKQMIRKIMTNSKSYKPLFVTLTYDYVQTSRDLAKSDMAKFIRKLRTQYPKIQYLYVLETQKSGSWHVHFLIFNIPFIPVKDLGRFWAFANPASNAVDVEKIQKTENSKHVAFYIAKYLDKEYMERDKDVKGNHRLFSCSLNLLSPEEFRMIYSNFAFDESSLEYSGGYFNVMGNFIRLTIYYDKT